MPHAIGAANTKKRMSSSRGRSAQNAFALPDQGCSAGRYLASANDPPPGNMVMWRGLSRLTDIEMGFALASE